MHAAVAHGASRVGVPRTGGGSTGSGVPAGAPGLLVSLGWGYWSGWCGMAAMRDELVCWKCGASVADELLPLSRRAECRACGAELHVCRLCTSYDPGAAGSCSEDRAEDVTDKERANFCDWFAPACDAYQPAERAAAEAARAQLEALFSGGREWGAAGPGAAARDARVRSELEDLFGAGGRRNAP